MRTVTERGARALRHDQRTAGRRRSAGSRASLGIAGVAVLTMALLSFGGGADAAIVPNVLLGTAANYSVLAGSTVTNTGPSTLDRSLGLSPGTSITGFPPGLVNAPGTTDNSNAAAQLGQAALTTAYVNAAGRPVNGTTTADLGNLELQAGVYSGPSKSALLLTGPLVLDGAGNLDSVFIFQTNSTLTTASSSTVTLINGAQECNVFWQIGSSATLGTNSVFRGNILAQASITVNNSVTVHGRALARSGAVTLDTDTFTSPTCARTVPPVTTTTTPTTTPTGGPVSTLPSGASGPTTPGASDTTDLTSSSSSRGGPGVPGVNGPPRTGATPVPTTRSPWVDVVRWGLVAVLAAAGLDTLRRERARLVSRRTP